MLRVGSARGLSWSFFDLQGRGVHIPAEVRGKIFEAFVKVRESPYEYTVNFDRLAKASTRVLEAHLPHSIAAAIQEVRDTEKGFLEITGIPQDPDLMDTPTHLSTIHREKSTFVSELFCMGISGLLKQEIYNFRQEGWGTGALIFNVFPNPSMLSIKGAGGTEKDFRLHMENAWHPQTPDTLLLKGVRQDHKAEAITFATPNRAVYDALSPSEQAALRNSPFVIRPPEIHRKMEREQGVIFSEDRDYVGPVAVAESTGIKLVVNFNGMAPFEVDPGLQKLLVKVEKLAMELSSPFKLKEDNMLVINNKRSIHTRNDYTPHFDGRDRWFQRYFLLEPGSLWRSLRIEPQDFHFLSFHDANGLIQALRDQGIMNGNILTGKSCPHDPGFVLSLPEHLESKRGDICKVLLRKGPVFPNRVV